ncbi:hypothetical protein PspR84_06335 [Pseudomonas sp. R84]|uniref:DUF4376 domain-containing protein n=1 Tax=Pseudomonas sp. R84 TaxID=1573712 RepID=UPI00131FB527|nr:DUF4376 domain-containing protein [Pseudomonas sp. R84]QHC94269.1 hypothetical protein PspR84_06335 [Pseudomonas sp. R84]
MLRAYSKEGTAFRGVAPDWPLAEGEILFDHEPSEKELEDAFGFASGELVKSRLLTLITAERFRREGSGVVVEGVAIDTSRDSQSLIAGMAVSAMLNPAYQCSYKAVDGFVELTASQILAVATAVRSHVQTCFDRERALSESVVAGTYTDAMLKDGWPDQPPVAPASALQ